jgi:methyl-accepting chemotaxis protein
MSEKQQYRRRHYFVKKEFQLKFMIKFCLLVFISAVLSTGLLLLLSQDTLTSSFHQSRLQIQSTPWAILPAAIFTNLITLGLISIATIMVILFISHKLAGPLFRFEKELKEIGQGDLTKVIRLRKKDQIKELAEDLNTMTAGLRSKVKDIKGKTDELMKLALNLDASQEITDGLKDLHQIIGTQFKI